jgi:hypothetical protein
MKIEKRRELGNRVAIAIIAAMPISALAHQDTLQNCANVNASPGNVIDAEHHDCGASTANGWPWNPTGTIQCGKVGIQIPKGYKILSTNRGIANNPTGVGMDWATWLGPITQVPFNGGYLISTELKNWATFPRIICVSAVVETGTP